MVGSIVLCMRRRYRKSRRRRYPHLAVKPKVATPRRLRSSGLLPQNEKADGFGFRPPRLRPGSISFTAFRRLVAAWADRRLSLRPDHRRLASALRSAKRPSLCGPATALAPSFVVRRTGFSLGEGLAYKFRLVSPVKEYSKPISRRWEAARGASGWDSRLARMGLTGRCPVTIKLMSQMIGVMLENGESPVKLLDQNHARQFVRQRHLSQRQDKPGLAPCFLTEAIAATNREEQRCRVHLLALQKLGQLFGGKLFPARIEENQLVPLFILLPQLSLDASQ